MSRKTVTYNTDAAQLAAPTGITLLAEQTTGLLDPATGRIFNDILPPDYIPDPSAPTTSTTSQQSTEAWLSASVGNRLLCLETHLGQVRSWRIPNLREQPLYETLAFLGMGHLARERVIEKEKADVAESEPDRSFWWNVPTLDGRLLWYLSQTPSEQFRVIDAPAGKIEMPYDWRFILGNTWFGIGANYGGFQGLSTVVSGSPSQTTLQYGKGLRAAESLSTNYNWFEKNTDIQITHPFPTFAAEAIKDKALYFADIAIFPVTKTRAQLIAETLAGEGAPGTISFFYEDNEINGTRNFYAFYRELADRKYATYRINPHFPHWPDIWNIPRTETFDINWNPEGVASSYCYELVKMLTWELHPKASGWRYAPGDGAPERPFTGATPTADDDWCWGTIIGGVLCGITGGIGRYVEWNILGETVIVPCSQLVRIPKRNAYQGTSRS